MDERFGRGERAPERPGDIFVAQFILSAEQDGNPLIFGQFGHRFLYFFFQLAMQQLLGRRESLSVFELMPWMVFLLRVGRFHRISRVP